MDQKISIKIAGRTFNLTAPTPETEQLYRQAAEAINKRFASFTRSHPGKTASDLLSLVALNEAVIRLDMQREIDLYKSAEKQLESDLDRYLKDQTK
ncbi:MAG: cell division protein ZapA [Bacteroidales bacterium]|jgi:cell division protein ZapA (FtsZ GTPase activity inhibitor)|nr:cell division protein ZapA [Bacteroidales bacterium]